MVYYCSLQFFERALLFFIIMCFKIAPQVIMTYGKIRWSGDITKGRNDQIKEQRSNCNHWSSGCMVSNLVLLELYIFFVDSSSLEFWLDKIVDFDYASNGINGYSVSIFFKEKWAQNYTLSYSPQNSHWTVSAETHKDFLKPSIDSLVCLRLHLNENRLHCSR